MVDSMHDVKQKSSPDIGQKIKDKFIKCSKHYSNISVSFKKKMKKYIKLRFHIF